MTGQLTLHRYGRPSVQDVVLARIRRARNAAVSSRVTPRSGEYVVADVPVVISNPARQPMSSTANDPATSPNGTATDGHTFPNARHVRPRNAAISSRVTNPSGEYVVADVPVVISNPARQPMSSTANDPATSPNGTATDGHTFPNARHVRPRNAAISSRVTNPSGEYVVADVPTVTPNPARQPMSSTANDPATSPNGTATDGHATGVRAGTCDTGGTGGAAGTAGAGGTAGAPAGATVSDAAGASLVPALLVAVTENV